MQAGDEPGQKFALLVLTSLFFIWGFITCLNDILIPDLKGIFELNYAQAILLLWGVFFSFPADG
ncbi:hypothetical protein ACCI51_04505 [Microbulbifer echini]|uniref:Glucose/galactose MFS transporter n=1 Tax=Microbulbifer echini TaxID=1529067 RepID=A0ABV4NKD0_9GAMM